MIELGYHCHELAHLEQAIISNGLRRGEFWNFPSEEVSALRQKIQQYELTFSFHTPFIMSPWYPAPSTTSYLCDPECEMKHLYLKMVDETLEQAREWGAEYVVVHFPFPLSHEARGISCQSEVKIAWETVSHLAQLSQKYNIPIHMEGFGPSPFLNTKFLREVTDTFPCLRHCFDVGHMYIAAQQDGFDFYQFAQELAPVVGSLHLWNARSAEDLRKYRHLPVHPVQKPEEGWIDIPRLFQLMLPRTPSCCIIFESSIDYHEVPEILENCDFHQGVEWIKELIATLS